MLDEVRLPGFTTADLAALDKFLQEFNMDELRAVDSGLPSALIVDQVQQALTNNGSLPTLSVKQIHAEALVH